MENINGVLVFTSLFWAFFIVLIAWSTAWKGFALWFAAKNNHRVWYIVMLVLQTAGILEIIYLTFVAKVFTKKPAIVSPAPTAPAASTDDSAKQ